MTYFRLTRVDSRWLETEIGKGTIFYKHAVFSKTAAWVSCGEYRDGAFSYDRLSAVEVLNMINRCKNVYWRN